MVLGVKKILLFSFWLSLMCGIIALLMREDQFFAVSGVPVASVVAAVQDVTYRSEDDIRWRTIGGSDQYLFDGDRLATGKRSSAVIDFGDNRAAYVGEDSSVALSTIRQAVGMTYILSLQKGSVSIEKFSSKRSSNPKKSQGQYAIIVRSDGQDFIIEPGEERGIAKDDKGVVQFVGKKRPKVRKKDVELPPPMPKIIADVLPSPVATPVVSVQPTPSPTPSPIPTPERKKVLPPNVKGTELKLDTSGLKQKYLSYLRLENVTGSIGLLRWRGPENPPPGWSGVIELSSGGHTKQILVKNSGETTLGLESFGTLKEDSTIDGMPCATLSVKGGARISFNNKVYGSMSGELFSIYICSFADAEKNLPLVVGMSSIDFDGSEEHPVLFEAPPKNPLPYQMTVVTPSQYRALLPLMNKSPFTRIAKTSGFSAKGIFVVKKNQVSLQLSSSGFLNSTTNVSKFALQLDADVVFRGMRESILSTSGLNAQNVKEIMARNTSDGRSVYAYKKGAMIPISREFLEQRKEVVAFITSVSTEIFTEPVQIIYHKNKSP